MPGDPRERRQQVRYTPEWPMVDGSPSSVQPRADERSGAAPATLTSAPIEVLVVPAPAERVDARRTDALALGTLLLITAVVMWQRLWFWNGLAHLDIPTFYLPWYAFMGEHLRLFQLPGWNPHQFSGVPFASDPQSGWMYFPAMVAFTLLPALTAYTWFLVFHVVLAAVSAYAFARVLGMGPMAALVTGAAYAFGPFVHHISCCVIHVQLSAWIPLALIGVEMGLRANRWPPRLGWWTLTGLCISQMVAGWVGQGAYNGLLVVGSFMAWRALFGRFVPGDTRQRAIRLIVDGAGVLILGLGISAAGLLPRLDSIRSTNLAGGEYSGYEVDKYAGGVSLSHLLDMLMTSNNGWRTWLFYLGGATLSLAIMAPFLARRRFASSYFLVLTIVVSALCLNGGPILWLFDHLFPRWGVLHEHVPTRITAVQWIGPAMLAGATIEALRRGWQPHRLVKAALAPLIAWGVVLPPLTKLDHNGAGTLTVVTVVLASLAVAAIAVVPHRWPRLASPGNGRFRQAMLIALLLLVVVDPTGRIWAGAVWANEDNPVLGIPTGPTTREAVEINAATTDPGGAGEFLQQAAANGEYVRYFGYDPAYYDGGWGYPSTYREFWWEPTAQALLVNARAMRLGLFDVQGYNPVQLSKYVHLLNEANDETQNYHDAQVLSGGIDSPLLDILNTRYIIIPANLPAGRPRADIVELLRTHKEVFRNDQVRILENENALPRAWVVHETRRTTADGALWLIDSGTIDPATTVVLPVNTPLPDLAPAPDGAAETVAITHFEPDTVRLSATLATPGIVVVSEVYDHGWAAYVDGEKTPIYLADGILRAVPVPAGTHTIELHYEPLSLIAGVWISVGFGVVSLALVGLAVWDNRRKHRRR